MQLFKSILCGLWVGCGVVALAIPSPQASAGELEVIRIRTGYLIVEGQYLQPPYKIECTNDKLTINGVEFDEKYFDAPEQGSEVRATPVGFEPEFDRSRGDRFGRRGFDRPSEFRGEGFRGWGSGDGFRGWGGSELRSIANDIEQASMGGIVIVYPEVRPIVLYPQGDGYHLLRVLTDQMDNAVKPPAHLNKQEALAWRRVVSEFQPSGDFLARAVDELKRVDEAGRAGDETSAAVFLSNRLAYPLSILAMIGVVLGFGHLLSNRPTADSENHDVQKSHKIIVQSLIIIAVFSVVDLIWTLTASNAGAMKELNPLGSQFIHDARLLTLFKLTVTGISIGILYSLRSKPIAHVASWWCCLLMTLLTARWVMFQSMFL
ncbi:hypothetical protein LOC67_03735 [Stieleria sp. JC731]|uniref:DUF5658 family protein n=1 Tax=Pirellulaceae TaxID=2691357 RepID=UPI001E3F2EC2|nr:DUF5658 family protein [Stieleria sp. JC731]MCC9599661.1 hypothetical protein [Stieleria sp. JC731]